METNSLHRVHLRDQAAGALDDVADVERRAAHHNTYPLWFWVFTALGIAAIPTSSLAGSGSAAVALGAAGVITVTSVLASVGRRSHDLCLSLGVRGWAHELKVLVPTLVVFVAAVAVSDAAPDAAVVAVAAFAAGAAWLMYGVLTRRVGSWRR